VLLYPLVQLQLLFVSGHPTSTDDRCFVWPLSSSDSLSPYHVHTVTSALKSSSCSARFVLYLCLHIVPK